MRLLFPCVLSLLFVFPACTSPITSGSPTGGQARFAGRPDAPKLRRLDNGHYRVRKPWTVQLNGVSYHVRQGYTSNGITAPTAIKSTLGDGVQHPETWASVFHDWLFTQPGMNRTRADRLFYDLLCSYGVPENKARLMYTSVRAYSARKQGS